MDKQNEKIYVTQSSMPTYEEYIEAIKPLWDSHWLTNMGKYHKELEKELREYLDVPQISLMVNGHMALEMAIQAMDFPEGAEVITTPFTFISTTHAIVRNRLKPVFCDVKLSDGTIDETKIEELITENTVAIVPVHVYGNICNVEEIQRIADKYSLKVIYDAAHAFGVTYKGKGIGNYGDASVFSFHATKVFNTIEGGAVTFSDPKLYDKLYNLKNFGIRGEELVVSVGANAKMNEFCAAMGICNLRHIDSEIGKRKVVYDRYMERLAGVNGLQLNSRQPDVTYNYSYFPVLFDERTFGASRNEVFDRLANDGICARKYFYPLTNTFACFHNKYDVDDTPVARSVANRVLTLPLYADLSLDDVDRICDVILDCKA